MDDLYIPDSSSEEFPRKGTPPVLSEAAEAPAATDDIRSAEIKIIVLFSDFSNLYLTTVSF
jgi:hypothetical protein